MKPVPRIATETMAGGIGASHQSTTPSPCVVSRVAELVPAAPAMLLRAAPALLPLRAARPGMSTRLYGPSNGTVELTRSGVAAGTAASRPGVPDGTWLTYRT